MWKHGYISVFPHFKLLLLTVEPPQNVNTYLYIQFRQRFKTVDCPQNVDTCLHIKMQPHSVPTLTCISNSRLKDVDVELYIQVYPHNYVVMASCR